MPSSPPTPIAPDVAAALEGVEGWLTDGQAALLQQEARRCRAGERIVEIGSFQGRSTIVLASAAADGVEVVAIDPHAGTDRGPHEYAGYEAEASVDHLAFNRNLEAAGVRDRVTLVDGNAQRVMAASDVVLLASGTATLEATLVKRPMVVAYRLSLLTTFLLKTLKLFKAPFFAQPNLLAGRQVVPEYFNHEVRADILGPAVLAQLERADRDQLVQTFASIHETLRRDASARAAEAILQLLS